MSYIDTMKLALAALNTTESDCGSRAWGVKTYDESKTTATAVAESAVTA